MLTDARNRPGPSCPGGLAPPATALPALALPTLAMPALAMLALLVAGCAEVEVGAEAYKSLQRANNPSAARPAAAPVPARPVRINPALQPDRAAFHAVGVTVWDGTPTLPGLWVTHPMAATARRVRLTSQATALQVDAALLRRDPGAAGPSITVSAEAARALGLQPGRATPITIEALVHAPPPAAGSLETTRLATASPAPEAGPAPEGETGQPGEVVPYAADATRAADREDHPGPARQPAPQPAPQPAAQPAPPPAPIPAAGEISDGRHYIQAGIFRQPENAARLTAALNAAALPVRNQALTLGNQPVTRVLVGPYATVAERDAALETVRALGPADAIPARG